MSKAPAPVEGTGRPRGPVQWGLEWVLVAAVACALLAGSAGRAGAQTLPQDDAWHVTLRDYIGTLQEADFEVTLDPMTWDPSYASSSDELLRYWTVLHYPYDSRHNKGVRAPARRFVLSNFETNGEVYLGPSWASPAATAYWALFDYPGNPHYASAPVKRRAFVLGAVDMMMLDQHHDAGSDTRSDYLAGNLIGHALAYKAAKDLLPADVRSAYEDGLIAMFEKIEQWGPTGIHSDTDTRAVFGMWITARVVEKADLMARAESYARTEYAAEYFSPAGYIDMGGAMDPSYNGVGIYYLTWGAAATGWSWLVDDVQQMQELKAHMFFPDDGAWVGPSSFSSGQESGVANDQHDYSYRDVVAAALSDEALYLVDRDLGDPDYASTNIPASESEMEQEIDARMTEMNGWWANFDDPYSDDPGPWQEDHWRSDLPWAGLYWVEGLWSRVQTLRSADDPLLRTPVERNQDYIKNFNDEFLAWKKGGVAGMIYTGPRSWYNNSVSTVQGHTGGTLAGLWRQGGGVHVLGRLRSNRSSTPDDWSSWQTWAAHSLTGVTAAGKVFSSSKVASTARYDVNGTTSATVSVSATIGPSDPETIENGDALSTDVTFDRLLHVDADGLTVTTSLTGSSNDQVTQLWEMLPWFGGTSGTFEGTIELEVNGSWQAASTTATADVDRVRFVRNGKTTYVAFERPRRVKLTPEVWTTDYQRPNDRIRGIMVDVLESGGDAVTMPDSAGVRYTVSATGTQPDANTEAAVPPLTIEGSAGTDGRDEGWRFLGPPVTGAAAEDLVRGDGRRLIDFSFPMAYGWDSDPESDATGWTPLSATSALANGRGLIVWVFDNAEWPVDPSMTINVPAALDPPGAVDVTVGDEQSPSGSALAADPPLAVSDAMHLLANPYPVAYNLGALGSGSDEFADAVQVWRPDATRNGNDPDGNDDGNVGSFVLRSRSSGDEIAPWQAFWLERSSPDSGSQTQITFASDGRESVSSPGFIGSNEASAATQADAGTAGPVHRLELSLLGTNRDDEVVASDRAAAVVFTPGASAGPDRYDARKLTPLDSNYAVIAPMGAAGDGSTQMQAQEGRPLPTDSARVPLAFVSQGLSGRFTVSLEDGSRFPDEWTVTLIDTKGTPTPQDDVRHRLRAGGDGYAFQHDASTSGTPGMDRRHGDLQAAGGPSSRAPTPATLTATRGATSESEGGARFVLRVATGAGPRPLELTRFAVETRKTSALLRWAAPMGPADGRYIVESRQRAADTGPVASEQRSWRTRGTVAVADSSADGEYATRAEPLAYGTHAFRLRWVGPDGRVRRSDVVSVDVRLEGRYQVRAPYPNPARGAAQVGVAVTDPQRVTVRLYDALGRQVAEAHRGKVKARQMKQVRLPIDGLAAGTYLVRITGETFATTRKLVVLP